MNKAWQPFIVVVVLFGAMASFAAWRKLSEPKDAIPWVHSLQDARAQAKASGKPIMLYFTASWCGPCQRMKAETWSTPEAKSALERVIAVKLDVDDSPDEARQFGVDGIPRIQILRADGSPGPAHVGFISSSELVEWLKAR